MRSLEACYLYLSTYISLENQNFIILFYFDIDYNIFLCVIKSIAATRDTYKVIFQIVKRRWSLTKKEVEPKYRGVELVYTSPDLRNIFPYSQTNDFFHQSPVGYVFYHLERRFVHRTKKSKKISDRSQNKTSGHFCYVIEVWFYFFFECLISSNFSFHSFFSEST